MSVLIKGMKMPVNCESCSVAHLAECELWMTAGYRQRHKDCPLVEVPTPHGRLIDTNELKDWIQAWFTMHRNYHPYSKSNLIPSTEIVDILDRLPTIIEAEEGEKA